MVVLSGLILTVNRCLLRIRQRCILRRSVGIISTMSLEFCRDMIWTLQMIIPIILIKVSPRVCLWIGMNRWPYITRKVLLTLCVMIKSSVFVRATMNRGGQGL